MHQWNACLKIKTIIFYTTHWALCYELTHYFCDDGENKYIVFGNIIIKLEIRFINHCLFLDNETISCIACLAMF